MIRRTLLLTVCVLHLAAASRACAEGIELEAPRIVATLEQGEAAEIGHGLSPNPELAAALYCDAGAMGSAEGFFRLGRVLAHGPDRLRNPALANAYFALAARLGHQAAFDAVQPGVEPVRVKDDCRDFSRGFEQSRFDLDGYVSGMAPARRRIAELILRHALRSGVDGRVALAVALVESNLDASAVSPRNAQGVMQLIPETSVRFGVRNPFDADANVRGGLAYLHWLHRRFRGDWTLAVAAYNAGEGAVERHGGVPPYRETRAYVRRVLYFAGREKSARP